MSRKPSLSVVPKDAVASAAATRRVLSVTKAAADGSHLELLEAMRDRVAKTVEDVNTPARDLAALTRRLMEITKEIEAIHSAAEQEAAESHVDDEDFDATAV